MNAPRWIDKRTLLLLHGESLAEHGGVPGIRDEGLLDSALAPPLNRHADEGESDLARLAAAYGVGIAKNHPFADGNKRAAFLAVGLFLALNGQRLVAGKAEATQAMLDVASGAITEEQIAAWIRARSASRA